MVGDFEKVLGVETLKTRLKADKCADADKEPSDWEKDEALQDNGGTARGSESRGCCRYY
jgi:hypothetical protein